MALVGIRGVKNKVAVNVAFLMLISAIITYFLVITVLQNVWIRTEIYNQKQLLSSLGHLFLRPAVSENPEEALYEKQSYLTPFSSLKQFKAILIKKADKGGYYLYSALDSKYPELLSKAIAKTESEKSDQHIEITLDWKQRLFQQSEIIITSFIVNEDSHRREIGVAAALLSVHPLYRNHKYYSKALFLYILINTAILTVTGLYRIFKIYLRPIDRIIRQADQYREENDPFFVFRREDNELNRLSSALNRMLNRIAVDKKKLNATVFSLKQANENLNKAHHEILRSEKMSSIGRLASGIAHEIGNPIGIVLGYLDLLKASNLKPDERQDFLKRAEKEVLRINTIIKQLLDLSRPKETNHKNMLMHPLLNDIVIVMRDQPIMREIDILLECRAENDMVYANEEQMRQIMLNLLLNASDAIKAKQDLKKGLIVVSTSNEAAENCADQSYLIIEVTDNGCGIADEDLASIFDPFFTTKEPGKGTGLGLSVSYMITEQIGGRIEARGSLGKGATIVIRLNCVGN